MRAVVVGLVVGLSVTAHADDPPVGFAVDADAEGVAALGVQGLASGKTGFGARVNPRLVYTTASAMQMRAGLSLTWWGGVAPYGHSMYSLEGESWIVASAAAEITWPLAPQLRFGPEISAAAPSLFSGDSRYPAGYALAIGIRLRNRYVTGSISVEHAWPSLAPPYDRSTDSFVISAGPSGKVGEITAAVTFAIGGLLLAAGELLPRD